MAPKQNYKVHSFKEHVQNANRGLTEEAQQKRRPGNQSISTITPKPQRNHSALFSNGADGNDDEDDDDTSSSDDSSESEDDGGVGFLSKLTGLKTGTPKPRTKVEDIVDSDFEHGGNSRGINGDTPAAKAHLRRESSSTSSTSSSGDEIKEVAKKASQFPGKFEKIAASDEDSDSESSSSEASSEEERSSKPVTVASALSKKESEETTSDDASSTSDNQSVERPNGSRHLAQSVPASSAPIKGDSTAEDIVSRSDEESKGKHYRPVGEKPSNSKMEALDSVSESDEYSESDGEAANGGPDVDESMHIADRTSNMGAKLQGLITPGFELRKRDALTGVTSLEELAEQARADGQQLWFFTVPANVPVSVLEDIEMAAEEPDRDNQLFRSNGQDWGMNFSNEDTTRRIQITIPASSNKLDYNRDPNAFARKVRITRQFHFPADVQDVDMPEPTVERPRQQPEGIRARYLPFGIRAPVKPAHALIGAHQEDSDPGDVDMPQPLPDISVERAKRAKPVKPVKSSEPIKPTESIKPAKSTKPAKPPKAKTSRKSEVTLKKPAVETEHDLAATPAPIGDSLNADSAHKGKRKKSLSIDSDTAVSNQLQAEFASAEPKPKKQKSGHKSKVELENSLDLASAKKVTPVLPPTVPSSSLMSSSLGAEAVTSAPTPAPDTGKKKERKQASQKKTDGAADIDNVTSAASSQFSSAPAPATGSSLTKSATKSPARQTAVPLPAFGSSTAASKNKGSPPLDHTRPNSSSAQQYSSPVPLPTQNPVAPPATQVTRPITNSKEAKRPKKTTNKAHDLTGAESGPKPQGEIKPSKHSKKNKQAVSDASAIEAAGSLSTTPANPPSAKKVTPIPPPRIGSMG